MFGVNYISCSFGPASPSNVEIVPFEGPFNAIMRNISTGTADILPDKLFMTHTRFQWVDYGQPLKFNGISLIFGQGGEIINNDLLSGGWPNRFGLRVTS